MKRISKKAFALLLLVCLMAGLLPTTAFAASNHDDHCVCGGDVSGHTHDTITDWKPLDLSGSEWLNGYQLQQSGSYYLTEDLVPDAALTFYAETAAEAITVNICLNGHSITKDNDTAIVINQHTTLNICNCGSTGKISNGISFCYRK